MHKLKKRITDSGFLSNIFTENPYASKYTSHTLDSSMFIASHLTPPVQNVNPHRTLVYTFT